MAKTKQRWIKSENDGALILDMPTGHWSVRRANGRRWVAALVKKGEAVWSGEFQTRREAMQFSEADAEAITGWRRHHEIFAT